MTKCRYEVYTLTIKTEELCKFDIGYCDIYDRYFENDNANQTLEGIFESEFEALAYLNQIAHDLRPFGFCKSFMPIHKYYLFGDVAYAYKVTYDDNGNIEDMDLITDLRYVIDNIPKQITKFNVYTVGFQFVLKGKHTISKDEILHQWFKGCEETDLGCVGSFNTLEDAQVALSNIEVYTKEDNGLFWGNLAYIAKDTYTKLDGFYNESDLDLDDYLDFGEECDYKCEELN